MIIYALDKTKGVKSALSPSREHQGNFFQQIYLSEDEYTLNIKKYSLIMSANFLCQNECME